METIKEERRTKPNLNEKKNMTELTSTLVTLLGE